ncbi:hypothetical protein [Sulfuricystis multivorans]|uniref:hypothetical protein n=1 Tax=Sulfuricystis multivorans TaxID=2211108 RepID=UPI000F831C7B|nr:hypothetical protein [Sulfuricystis multivorans]
MNQNQNTEVLAEVDPGISEAEVTSDDVEKGESVWLGRLISLVTTVLIVVIVLIAYHYFYVLPNKQRYAVVDLSEVLNIKELQVTIAAMRPDASEEAKLKAYDDVAKFGKDVGVALNELQQECGCSIFVKAAVVKPAGAEDLTPELKRRLGMENVNQDELVKQLRSLGGGSRTPIIEGDKK